jgi:hypothetical protein
MRPRRIHRWPSLRVGVLVCVYGVGVIAILASGSQQVRPSCSPATIEIYPYRSVRLVSVTPPIPLPTVQVMTIDRQDETTSAWVESLVSACQRTRKSRYIPKGNVFVLDGETRFGFGFVPLDLKSYERSEGVVSAPFGLSVLVKNGFARGVSIDWNAVTLIDPTGKAHGVIHRGVRMEDRARVLAPSTIPPGAILEEFVYPKEMVGFAGSGYGGDWIGINFFEAMKPQEQFKLYLPVKHGNDTVEYQFVFEVNAPVQ